MCCKGARHIDPMHQAPAEEGAKRISVVGQNNLNHLGLRIGYRAGEEGFLVHSSSFAPATISVKDKNKRLTTEDTEDHRGAPQRISWKHYGRTAHARPSGSAPTSMCPVTSNVFRSTIAR